jgi:hypothetical protein
MGQQVRKCAFEYQDLQVCALSYLIRWVSRCAYDPEAIKPITSPDADFLISMAQDAIDKIPLTARSLITRTTPCLEAVPSLRDAYVSLWANGTVVQITNESADQIHFVPVTL